MRRFGFLLLAALVPAAATAQYNPVPKAMSAPAAKRAEGGPWQPTGHYFYPAAGWTFEPTAAAQPVPAPVPPKFARGHKDAPADVAAKRHADAAARHGVRVGALPAATPAAFDCRTMGWVGQVQDQGNCGSCWDVSATGVVTNAYVKAGLAKADGSWVLSPQYVLDGCGGKNGGCNGDDAPTVLDVAKAKGLPTTADYGPYTAHPGRCRFDKQKLYKISDWGFCTPNQAQGIAATQDIKNCLVQYGALSTAVAANSDWDNVTPGSVMPFRKLSPSAVDHDVSIVGWDDAKQAAGSPVKGAWLVLNQWGQSWGDSGYCWIGYGSHQIGTEAAWVTVAALPPPPGPGPTPPPDPVPPTPVPPAPGGPFTGTLVYQNGVLVAVTHGAPPATAEADLTAAGVSPAVVADTLTLIADLKARKPQTVIMADLLKIATDLQTP